MKHKIEQIFEREDGAVFTVSRGRVRSVRLSRQTINNLVEQGMDREEAENLRGIELSARIMRAPHMDADVPVDDATKDLIDKIKDKK